VCVIYEAKLWASATVDQAIGQMTGTTWMDQQI
jgi:hypothetical protein